jgi:hypothetical protein
MKSASIPPFAQETFLEPPPRESGRALAIEATYPLQRLDDIARYGMRRERKTRAEVVALYAEDGTPRSPEQIVDG